MEAPVSISAPVLIACSYYLCYIYKCSGCLLPYGNGNLQDYPPLSPPSTSVGRCSSLNNNICDEGIHLNHNLFSVPLIKVGTYFVQELVSVFF